MFFWRKCQNDFAIFCDFRLIENLQTRCMSSCLLVMMYGKIWELSFQYREKCVIDTQPKKTILFYREKMKCQMYGTTKSCTNFALCLAKCMHRLNNISIFLPFIHCKRTLWLLCSNDKYLDDFISHAYDTFYLYFV